MGLPTLPSAIDLARISPFTALAGDFWLDGKKTNSGITMIQNKKNYTAWGDCAGNIFKTGEFS